MASTEITPAQRVRNVLLSAEVMGAAAETVARMTAPAAPLAEDYPLPEGRMTKAREAGYREAARVHRGLVNAEHLAHGARALHAAEELAEEIARDPERVVSALRQLAGVLAKAEGLA